LRWFCYTNILGFIDDDIEFQVHNIEEMVHNVERHGGNDQYSNGELVKYKKMIKNSKKPFYHGCAAYYTRLLLMVKLFELKVSNRWCDCSFMDLLMLLKDMLPQGNTVPKTVYEAKQIICPLGLKVEKSMHARMIVFYIVGLSMKTSRNALFVDSTVSIIEKMVVMTRIAYSFNHRKNGGDDYNLNSGSVGGFTFIFVSCGESRLLISWCVGGRCGMVGSDKDRGRSRRPGAEDRGWSSTSWVLGGRTIERSGDVVCGLHRAQGDEERRFLSLTSKPSSTVCQWFDLKTTRSGFSTWS
jgi:hypothetical protein